MADDAVKQLLLKFTTSTDAFEDSVKKIRETLGSLEEEEKGRVAQSKADQAAAVDSQKEQLKLHQAIKSEAQADVALERARTAELKTQQAEISKTSAQEKAASDAQINASRLKTEAARTAALEQRRVIDQQIAQARQAESATRRQAAEQAAAARAKAADIATETALIRKQQAEESASHRVKMEHLQEEGAAARKEARETREGGGGGLLGSVSTGLFGKGLLGNVAGGVLLGNLEFEALYQGLEKLTDKVKEFIEDSGGLQKVLETFDKLSKGFGENPSEFMDKLFESTNHLIPQLDLLRTANLFMQSGLKVSSDDMLKLTQATVGLARAQGKDAKEAVQALGRAFLTGRAQMLAYVTGIQRTDMMVRNMGSTISNHQRNQIQFDQTMKVIIQRYQQLGEPSLTFTDRLTQMKVMTDEVFENFAQGVVKSGGFTTVLGGINDLVGKFGSLEKAGKSFGNTIGDAIGAVVMNVKPLLQLLGDVFHEFAQITDAGDKLFNLTLSSDIDKTQEKLSSFQKFLLNFSTTLNLIVAGFREMANVVGLVGNVASAVAQGNLTSNKALLEQDPRYGQLVAKKQAEMQAAGVNANAVTYQGAAYQFEKGTALGVGTGTYAGDWALAQLAKEKGVRQQDLLKTAPGQKGIGERVGDAFTQFKQKEDEITQDLTTNMNENEARMKSGGRIEELKTQLESNKQVTALVKAARDKYGKNIPIQAQLDLNKQMEDILREKKVTPGPGGSQVISYSPKVAEVEARQAVGAYFTEDKGTRITPSDDPSLAYKIQQQVDKANIERRKKAADEAFEDAKAKIQEETDLNEKMYKSGEEDAHKYYATKKKEADDTYAATTQHIYQEIEAQKQSIANQVKENNLSQQAAKIQLEAIEHDRQRQLTAAAVTRSKAYQGADIGLLTEQQGARNALSELELKNTKNVIAQETEALKYAFQQQLISAGDYTKKRIELVEETAAAEKKRRDEALANESGDAKARLNTLQQYQQQLQAHMKELQEMQENLPQEMLQDIQSRAQNQLGVLQSRLSIAQSGTQGMALAGGPIEIQEQIKTAMQAQIEAQAELLKQLQPYSDSWYKVYQSILKSTEQLQSFNEQLERSKSIQPILGSVLGAFSQQLSGLFGSRFARGLEAAMSGVAQQLQNAPALANVLKGKPTGLDPKVAAEIKPAIDASNAAGTAFKQTGDIFTQINQQLKTAVDGVVQQLNALAGKIAGVVAGGQQAPEAPAGLSPQETESIGGPAAPVDFGNKSPTVTGPSSSGGGFLGNVVKGIGSLFGIGAKKDDGSKATSLTDSFGDLAKKTVALTEAFGSFITTIQNSGSASAGAFAGVTGGASLGSSLASGFNLSGGAAAGVTGGLAAAGLIFGIISGQKQEQVQDDINQLNMAAKKFMDAFSSGNVSLTQTIANLQELISQAQIDMAETKKGSSQFKQLIIQYQEQIDQLQNQAQQTMTQLQEQLDVLSSPKAYQSMISSIEQVVQQYTQFVGAAQNTQQLAQANQFLTESLQQLAEGYSEQLLQDEQSAVQNALQLNSLLNQRNQLQYQFLQQTEQIMGQGTLTRSQTLAQSKYAQMYQASVQYSNQLMDINAQIAVAQAQVTAAQQVFQLATTRQGLESQMVALQTASIQLDMSRIAAMKSLLQTLENSSYSIANLGNVNPSDPNALILAILSTLLSQLGLSSSSGNMSTLINTLQGIMNGSGSQGPNPTGALGNISSAAYAQMARLGIGGFNGVSLT
jgi:hypothetical protein